MRSRYSRRIYSMKFGTEKSDFIDDEDIKFLENLSAHHRTYVDNLQKKLQLDVSLLSPKFVHIYNNISKHYTFVETSEEKSELYHNFDLRYDGEEIHIRNLREQIIHYLDNKKHQIFTNHRVEFFINIALNTKLKSLRDICRVMSFNYKSNKRLTYDNTQKKSFVKLKYNSFDKRLNGNYGVNFEAINEIIERIQENGQDESVMNDEILHSFAKMDTLLLPYIKMLHPKSDLDYETAEKMISETLSEEMKENLVSVNENDIGDVSPSDDVEINSPAGNEDKKLPDSPIIEKTCFIALENLNEKQLQISPNCYVDDVSEKSPNENANSNDEPCQLIVKHSANHNAEIIEISDEEDEESDEIKLKHSDIDQMIDFLIHRCNIQPDRHPSLLKDHQMHVELNGFLLFVNFSIRFSLKYSLDSRDRRIFDCIFISSIIVGLTCLVYINESGINIERLTNEGYQIVCTRLKSVELTIKDWKKVGDSYSVLINPDITRLMHLTLCYVRGYHDTGELREK